MTCENKSNWDEKPLADKFSNYVQQYVGHELFFYMVAPKGAIFCGKSPVNPGSFCGHCHLVKSVQVYFFSFTLSRRSLS